LLRAALQTIGLHGVEVDGGDPSLIAEIDTQIGSAALRH
jgi:hypothetical protein